MLSPFTLWSGKAVVTDFCAEFTLKNNITNKLLRRSSQRPVVWLLSRKIQSVLPFSPEDIESLRNMFQEAAKKMKINLEIIDSSDEAEEERRLDIDTGAEVWAAACIFDAVLNGTDYSRSCEGFEEDFVSMVMILRKDLCRKKNPCSYTPEEVIDDCCKALDYVLGVDAESALAEDMQENGKGAEFGKCIRELKERLSDFSGEVP